MALRLEHLEIKPFSGYAKDLRAEWGKTGPKRLSRRKKKLAIQKALAVGAYLFRQVREVEKAWLHKIVTGFLEYDAKDERLIRAMYSQWHEGIDEVKARLAELGPSSKVSGRKTFERQAAEVARILDHWPNHRKTRPVRIGEDGSLREVDGRIISIPGMEPPNILRSIEEGSSGQVRSLKAIMAERRTNAL